jgi:hypothetical protein
MSRIVVIWFVIRKVYFGKKAWTVMAMQGAFNFRRLTHFTFEMRGAKDSMGPV